jgi:HD superfamily phosphodiesterase
MSEFLEDQLRKALQRQEAPDGFADRLMAKLPEARRESSRFWYAAVAAVLAIALLFTGMQQRHREQQVHARETERQVVFALALAMQKFEHVNARLQKAAPKVRVEEGQGEL